MFVKQRDRPAHHQGAPGDESNSDLAQKTGGPNDTEISRRFLGAAKSAMVMSFVGSILRILFLWHLRDLCFEIQSSRREKDNFQNYGEPLEPSLMCQNRPCGGSEHVLGRVGTLSAVSEPPLYENAAHTWAQPLHPKDTSESLLLHSWGRLVDPSGSAQIICKH